MSPDMLTKDPAVKSNRWWAAGLTVLSILLDPTVLQAAGVVVNERWPEYASIASATAALLLVIRSRINDKRPPRNESTL